MNDEGGKKLEIMEPSIHLVPHTYIRDMAPYSKLQTHHTLPSSEKETKKNLVLTQKTIEEHLIVQMKEMKDILEPQKKKLVATNFEPFKREENTVVRRGSWSQEEKERFEEGYQNVGKNWTAIAQKYVVTRTRRQVGKYANKIFSNNK